MYFSSLVRDVLPIKVIIQSILIIAAGIEVCVSHQWLTKDCISLNWLIVNGYTPCGIIFILFFKILISTLKYKENKS